MRSAMSNLFRDERVEVRELIKLKVIYEQLELISTAARTWPISSRASSSRTPDRSRSMATPEIAFWVIAVLVGLALLFDFMNGFHDAANSIATVVSTGVLKPQQAVLFAAFFNFIIAIFFQLSVAGRRGQGHRAARRGRYHVVFGALVGAIVWNVVTWWYGIPSSSSTRLDGRHCRAHGWPRPARVR